MPCIFVLLLVTDYKLPIHLPDESALIFSNNCYFVGG